MKFYPIIICLIIFSGYEALPAAEDPHQHGTAVCEIAIEDSTVSVTLSIPAINVVGFEHQPGTEEERRAFEKARLKLSGSLGQKLLTVSNATLVSLRLTQEQHEPGHEGTEDAHSEFILSYLFSFDPARQPGQINPALLFDTFAGLQKVRWVALLPFEQRVGEATAKAPLIDLS